MLLKPFLIAAIPGIIMVLITWWLKKMNLSIKVRIIPGILTVIVSIIMFYIGYARVRGFEGGAYMILSIYLLSFAGISFAVAKKWNDNVGTP